MAARGDRAGVSGAAEIYSVALSPRIGFRE